ncbi:Rossmann-like and DUF2520 domain-containing protein [Paludibacterium paludis]|uniref:NADP oxidoreductase n=1 Tax=Paludibacterium paludis TaxID=1225769 RepID=A0A918P1S6_9NEIS|nr:Rossmann-like and DUF2520 domain-containing protein [Paludibacterium paludis]GGY10457.1 NADP oxidoreductase [Paludibacterium paludis]
MTTLNIIGTGRVGRVLGRLSRGHVRIGALCNRRLATSEEAAAFIGEGEPLDPAGPLPAADLWLLAVPDDAIAPVAQTLRPWVRAGDTVFHASGASESALLGVLTERGALVASVHPALSFADPLRSLDAFSGTLCALEGDTRALPGLEDWVRAIGGRPFRLSPGGKAAYHAALSMAANYLVALNALAMKMASKAGVESGVAGELVGALMSQTLGNTLALGPAAALTGPISRGDAGTVTRHLAAMADDAVVDGAYRAMGLATLELAEARLSREGAGALDALLRGR